jgi:anti-sigma B factor antagonist
VQTDRAGGLAIADGKPGLKIDIQPTDQATVVRLAGDVDLNVSSQLRARLKELVREQRPRIVVDMAGVPYVDSSGVATLVECLQGVSRYGGKLCLAALTTRTRSVFEISRLDTVFSIARTVEEALQA